MASAAAVVEDDAICVGLQSAGKEARSSGSYAWHPARHEFHRNCVIKGEQLLGALIRGGISGELIRIAIS
jgi:hypothetical protein